MIDIIKEVLLHWLKCLLNAIFIILIAGAIILIVFAPGNGGGRYMDFANDGQYWYNDIDSI